jgi:hypothetical protein
MWWPGPEVSSDRHPNSIPAALSGGGYQVAEGILLEVEPAAGRRAAKLKLQPDPRQWGHHVPDDLLAKWTDSVGLDSFEATLAKLSVCEPEADPLGGHKRSSKKRGGKRFDLQTPQGAARPDLQTPEGPTQRGETESLHGDERRHPDGDGVVVSALRLEKVCFRCGDQVDDDALAILALMQLHRVWHLACWSALSDQQRTQIEFIAKKNTDQDERDVYIRQVLQREAPTPRQPSSSGAAEGTGDTPLLAPCLDDRDAALA